MRNECGARINTEPRMVTRVYYEWDIEEFDPVTEDIIDHDHSDKCPGIPTEPNYRLVLVRDSFRGLSGEHFNFSCDLVHRCWAYVEDGKLPEAFDEGTPVPKRFHIELLRKQLSDVESEAWKADD